MESQPSRRRCTCGHEREAHEHYRAGTDCALCGAAVCPRFRRRSWRPWSLLPGR